MKQDHKKYSRVIDFMKALPKFEAMIQKDMLKNDLSKDNVCAWMMRIMELLNIRIGNDCYAKENNDYGFATLLKKHIHQRKTYLLFKFLGKSKQRHALKLKDSLAIEFINKLLQLPEDHLFLYKLSNDYSRVKSEDLNKYLQKGMGDEFTCKDYRTYAANKYFLEFIRKETKKFSTQYY